MISKKLFLEKCSRKEDRDFLSFLWWNDPEKRNIRNFRHIRIDFGVESSPFLLASIINKYHIKTDDEFNNHLKQQLLRIFYDEMLLIVTVRRKNWKGLLAFLSILWLKVDLNWKDENIKKTKIKSNTAKKIEFVVGLQCNRPLNVLKINVRCTNNMLRINFFI